MRLPRLSLLVLLALLAAAGLDACRSAELAVDPALAGSTAPLAVAGANPRSWRTPISFGAYRTSAVDIGATRSWLVEALGLGVGEARQPYAVTLETPSGPVRLECVNRQLEAYYRGFFVELTGRRNPVLLCGVRAASGDGWALSLSTAAPVGYAGAFAPVAGAGGERLEVVSIHSFAGTPISSPDPVGWQIGRASAVLAAVESINAGRVWLAPTLEAGERDRLAALAAALLLFDPAASDLDP
jgi:hypothetical protein